MAPDRKPQLTLIHGGASASHSMPRSLVAVSTSPDQPVGHGPRREPAGCIVSLGLDGLGFHEFRDILRVTAIRHVADIRVLATFRGNGFRLRLVEQTFQDLHIEYDRLRGLENPFATAGIGASVGLKKYGEHLKQQAGILRELGHRAEHGALLLLGRAAPHQGSEREVIVEEMARLRMSFRLLVVRKQERAVHVVPYDITAPEPDLFRLPPNAPRGRLRRAKANDAQVPLPFGSLVEGERERK